MIKRKEKTIKLPVSIISNNLRERIAKLTMEQGRLSQSKNIRFFRNGSKEEETIKELMGLVKPHLR
jgi:DNA recombination-dependent growth factor C